MLGGGSFVINSLFPYSGTVQKIQRSCQPQKSCLDQEGTRAEAEAKFRVWSRWQIREIVPARWHLSQGWMLQLVDS